MPNRNRPQRNNNPLNLRFAHQKEAIGVDGDGFAQFDVPEAGWRAAHAQINLDKKRNLTLREFLNKFAPPEENDTLRYLIFICGELNVNADTPLKSVSTLALAGVMAAQEGYYAKEAA